MADDIVFTTHAQATLVEPAIKEEWVWRTLQSAERQEIGEDGNTHFLKAISEFDNRILRCCEQKCSAQSNCYSVFRPSLEEETMRLRIDRESDALYLRLDETAIVESEQVQPGVILDYDKDGRVVGIEILGLSQRMAPEKLKTFQLETT
jgi:uncharacterized protein YuzE